MQKFNYYIFHKPYHVLSQFTSIDNKLCLKNYCKVNKHVYPIGRLDFDSEGLLLLSDNKAINQQLLNPDFNHIKTYFVQVEGIPKREDLIKLESGVIINLSSELYTTKPCKASFIDEPNWLEERKNLVRERASIPTCWVSITLTEGKNRQVRRMLAAIGFPVLRLIRYSIENITINGLKQGQVKQISKTSFFQKLRLKNDTTN
jgi:23S rRNA pseudouridine2457 synthase